MNCSKCFSQLTESETKVNTAFRKSKPLCNICVKIDYKPVCSVCGDSATISTSTKPYCTKHQTEVPNISQL